MDKLINTINKLAAKYNFTEDELEEIRQDIFNIEDPKDDVDMNVEEFKAPDMEGEEVEIDE